MIGHSEVSDVIITTSNVSPGQSRIQVVSSEALVFESETFCIVNKL